MSSSSSPASARCPRSSTSSSISAPRTSFPIPTIESYEGVGNGPGYRGLAYIVFNDFQLEKFGNRIPNFRFEVTSNGTDDRVRDLQRRAPVSVAL